MTQWTTIWEDPDYIIENRGGHYGDFRYRPTDPSISGSDRLDNLPKGYAVNHEADSWRLEVPTKWRNYKKPEAEQVPFIDSNPKTAFGAVKPGSFQTPMVPFYEYSLAHYQGALKYGHFNWREDAVSISTYIEAARRHIDLYVEGQKDASDTGIHNLAHAMTCLSIVIDAEWYGTLIDDRSTFGNSFLMEEYFESKKAMRQKIAADWTGHAEKLKAKLAAKKEEAK